MHKVRTTMQPDVEIEVSDAEYLDLQRLGVLKGEKSADSAEDEKSRAVQAAMAKSKNS